MAKHGFNMSACDLSLQQIKHASDFALAEKVNVDLYVADGASLPYKDCTFDFIFSVNVFHHITQFHARWRAFHEIVRVLKPGGISSCRRSTQRTQSLGFIWDTFSLSSGELMMEQNNG
jgi:SAM-dependent methyltransferase